MIERFMPASTVSCLNSQNRGDLNIPAIQAASRLNAESLPYHPPGSGIDKTYLGSRSCYRIGKAVQFLAPFQ